ncbi:hypothetical protein AVEN_230012-1 [Araneus ventricosus]|uniref:Uncharacterized protein n=1 Tax=Araneus ventricosus TaxID=182803 RepID=A0A4Y2CSY3_ARAVE|nr:hypothetical protein AVEN_230012-1 [Araneus ventricosus]
MLILPTSQPPPHINYGPPPLSSWTSTLAERWWSQASSPQSARFWKDCFNFVLTNFIVDKNILKLWYHAVIEKALLYGAGVWGGDPNRRASQEISYDTKGFPSEIHKNFSNYLHKSAKCTGWNPTTAFVGQIRISEVSGLVLLVIGAPGAT